MLIADLLCVGHCKGNCSAKIKVPSFVIVLVLFTMSCLTLLPLHGL